MEALIILTAFALFISFCCGYVYKEDKCKKDAILFAEWIKDNHYTRNINSDDTRWYKYFSIREDYPAGFSILSGVSEYFTSEELYSLYQQSKNKQP